MSIRNVVLLQSGLFLLLSYIGIQNSWALRCLEGPKPNAPFNIDGAKNTSHTTNVGTIRVTNSNQGAGTMLWQSPTYNTTLTCYDDYKTNNSENAYLYPDDNASQLSNAFKGTNLMVGILYKGREYEIKNNQDKIDTGQAALRTESSSSAAADNCRFIGKYDRWSLRNSCATPYTINISYSLFIKSRGTGQNYKSTIQNFTAFQVDGVASRNSSGNFQEKLSNLQVSYIDCVPKFTTQNVDLGKYYTYQDVNRVLRRTPFTVQVGVMGKDCASSTFAGRLTSPNPTIDSTTFTTTQGPMQNAVGIRIYEEGKTSPIELNKTIDFGTQKSNILNKNFEAGVLFLKKPPSGKFNAVLNYEVWLK